ncbi:hypothetical protein H5410_006126 [Solanum commersonii]|uniref:Uncharacterized protein n=1 Tax=Solanum commersonii TaxID=4109 RepID=A0A9J6A9B4_SOLCO|nr:hypothetical protein H5410_006126 [Solanum commersonii]
MRSRWIFGRIRTRQQRCLMNGGGVQWFRCIKTRVISEDQNNCGYQTTKPYYEDLGKSGGDEGEKRGIHF